MNAMFLDRDGVINEVLSHRVKFVNKPSQFYLLDGVGEAIKKFNDDGYKVFVVTNQGGVGLGYMTAYNLNKIHKKMIDDIAHYHAVIDDIAYCPHKPQAQCSCRKPKPTMLYRLAKAHKVRLNKSYMVGDRSVDIETGERAGTKTVLIGNREQEDNRADLIFPNLYSFSKWITN